MRIMSMTVFAGYFTILNVRVRNLWPRSYQVNGGDMGPPPWPLEHPSYRPMILCSEDEAISLARSAASQAAADMQQLTGVAPADRPPGWQPDDTLASGFPAGAGASRSRRRR